MTDIDRMFTLQNGYILLDSVLQKIRYVIYLGTLCKLGNFFKLFCHLHKLFQKFLFFRTGRLSKSLDPDQDRPSGGPDQGPNCLQRLTAEDKICQRQRVTSIYVAYWLLSNTKYAISVVVYILYMEAIHTM